jgi:quinol monooxygenase YgiN
LRRRFWFSATVPFAFPQRRAQDPASQSHFAMIVVHVHVRVKPECVEAFEAATLENARNSVKEAGVASFDVVQQDDQPTQFVLVEAYRSQEATAAHKETQHYQVWRDTVAPMMAEPRKGIRYVNVFPEDAGW